MHHTVTLALDRRVFVLGVMIYSNVLSPPSKTLFSCPENYNECVIVSKTGCGECSFGQS